MSQKMSLSLDSQSRQCLKDLTRALNRLATEQEKHLPQAPKSPSRLSEPLAGLPDEVRETLLLDSTPHLPTDLTGNVEDFEHDLLFSPKVIKKLTEAVKAEMKESE